jgi:hypothetical protein
MGHIFLLVRNAKSMGDIFRLRYPKFKRIYDSETKQKFQQILKIRMCLMFDLIYKKKIF